MIINIRLYIFLIFRIVLIIMQVKCFITTNDFLIIENAMNKVKLQNNGLILLEQLIDNLNQQI